MKLVLRILKLYYIFFIPIFFLIRLIRPFLLIRFGEVASARIGHFACTIDLYLCEIDNKVNIPQKKFIDIFILGTEICNTQIEKFWKKKLLIIPRPFISPLIFFNRIFPGGNLHDIFHRNNHVDKANFFSHRDEKNLIDISKKHFSFDKKEIFLAENICNKLDINTNKKIAIINIRDNFYFKKNNPKNNYNYFDVKNCKIDNYKNSILKLIENGYLVIRTGKGSEKTTQINNKNFIDITNQKQRTDLLECYLHSKCKLFIGNNSGSAYASIFLFRKPTFISNMIPIGIMYGNSKNIFTNFKIIRSNKSKNILSLSELKKMNILFYQRTSMYEELDLHVEETDEKDLQDYVEEFILKVENKWNFDKEELDLKSKFLNHFKSLAAEKNYYDNLKCDISYKFLKKNKDWLLN